MFPIRDRGSRGALDSRRYVSARCQTSSKCIHRLNRSGPHRILGRLNNHNLGRTRDE